MSPLWCMLRLWSVQHSSIICFEWANSPLHFFILLNAHGMQLCTRNMKYSVRKYAIDATPPVFFFVLLIYDQCACCFLFASAACSALTLNSLLEAYFFLICKHNLKSKTLTSILLVQRPACGQTDRWKHVEANIWVQTIGQRSAQGLRSNRKFLGCSSIHNRPSRFSLLNYTVR